MDFDDVPARPVAPDSGPLRCPAAAGAGVVGSDCKAAAMQKARDWPDFPGFTLHEKVIGVTIPSRAAVYTLARRMPS